MCSAGPWNTGPDQVSPGPGVTGLILRWTLTRFPRAVPLPHPQLDMHCHLLRQGVCFYTGHQGTSSQRFTSSLYSTQCCASVQLASISHPVLPGAPAFTHATRL